MYRINSLYTRYIFASVSVKLNKLGILQIIENVVLKVTRIYVSSIPHYCTVGNVSSAPYLNRNVSASRERLLSRSVQNVEVSQTNVNVTLKRQTHIFHKERSSATTSVVNSTSQLRVASKNN